VPRGGEDIDLRAGETLGKVGFYCKTLRLADPAGDKVVRQFSTDMMNDDMSPAEADVSAEMEQLRRGDSLEHPFLLPWEELIEEEGMTLLIRPYASRRLEDLYPPPLEAEDEAAFAKAMSGIAAAADTVLASGLPPRCLPENQLVFRGQVVLADWGVDPIVRKIESSYYGPRPLSPSRIFQDALEGMLLDGGLPPVPRACLQLLTCWVWFRTGSLLFGVKPGGSISEYLGPLNEAAAALRKTSRSGLFGSLLRRRPKLPGERLLRTGEREVLNVLLREPDAFADCSALVRALRS
jgi:hypothetical protein